MEVTTKIVITDSITVKYPTTLRQEDITSELFDIRDGNVNKNSMAVTQITNLEELLEITDENVTNITTAHQYVTTLLQADLTTNEQQLNAETEGYITTDQNAYLVRAEADDNSMGCTVRVAADRVLPTCKYEYLLI